MNEVETGNADTVRQPLPQPEGFSVDRKAGASGFDISRQLYCFLTSSLVSVPLLLCDVTMLVSEEIVFKAINRCYGAVGYPPQTEQMAKSSPSAQGI